MPNDAIKLSVESQPQWEIGKINKIKVILNIKLVELVDPVIKVKVGKNSEIPKWMTFSLDSQKNSQYEYILSGNPENRVNEENNVSEYEIEFLLSYNKEKTSARTIELLKFYQSQNSHLVSIGIKKNRSEK